MPAVRTSIKPSERPATTEFRHEGQTVTFQSTSADEYILSLMRQASGFYESDVLGFLQRRLLIRPSASVAVDVGAFIGTHSVFLAKFCGLTVLAYEANPKAYQCLVANIRRNEVETSVAARNLAVSNAAGRALVVENLSTNQGATQIQFVRTPPERLSVRAATLDDELRSEKIATVDVLKIDVEGHELNVLDGARDCISQYRPLICIEIHTVFHLIGALRRLSCHGYVISNCLGASPTYVLEPTGARRARRLAVNYLWFMAKLAPSRFRYRLEDAARRSFARLNGASEPRDR